MAAQLKDDPTLDVRNVSGRFNELRVEVDGRDVFESSWYPAPGKVVAAVREALAARSGPG